MTKHCKGCGIALQNALKEKDGYVSDITKDYCERCFKMTHYHELTSAKKKINNKSIISKIKPNSFVIFCLDFININDEVKELYKSIKEKKIILIMKNDIIPKSIKESKIINYLRNFWQVKEPIITTDKYHYSFRTVETYIPNIVKNVYVLGPTNVGKSSFINSLLNSQGLNGSLTVSEMPNTTLDWIKIETNNYTIYDSVGFTYLNNYSKDIIKKSNIKKEMKPISIQSPDAAIKIDNVGFIKTKNKYPITWFGSNNIEVTKYYGEVEYSNIINIPKNTNVFIRGIGFFYFKEEETISIANIKEDNIIISSSFVGGTNGQD